jgi:hypothetical protein
MEYCNLRSKAIREISRVRHIFVMQGKEIAERKQHTMERGLLSATRLWAV